MVFVKDRVYRRLNPSQTAFVHPAQGDFCPAPWIHSGLAQTLFSLHQPADLLTRRLVQPLLIDAGADRSLQSHGQRVRLLGYYGRSLSPTYRRGLVLLLHGWNGCSHSEYNQLLGDALLRAGYDIFQLNLRDHGPGLHVDPYALNVGMFHGALIDEVVAATEQIAALSSDAPFFIVGASMGGSFAVRLALRQATANFRNLCHVIAICPALNPERAVQAIDRNPIYRNYFRRKWLTSLLSKERYFPDVYDVAPLLKIERIHEMTEWWAPRYTGYESAQDYYAHYTVYPQDFDGLEMPTTIITAADDPVIPALDFYALPQHPQLDVRIYPTGGHVGFVDVFPVRHYLPQIVRSIIEQT
jgi:hypothetical protein